MLVFENAEIYRRLGIGSQLWQLCTTFRDPLILVDLLLFDDRYKRAANSTLPFFLLSDLWLS